jgi:hypothetical protein
MLLAGAINATLSEQFPQTLVGKQLRYPEISHRLSAGFRPFGFLTQVVVDRGLQFGKRQDFTVSGFFDTDLKVFPMRLTVHMDPSRSAFTYTKHTYNRFVFEISQALQHELVHQAQYLKHPKSLEENIHVQKNRRISKTRITEIDYLRNKSEIDAYAHDIAMEINAFYPHLSTSTVLRNLDTMKRIKTYRIYTQMFKNMDWTKVQKELFRKIWKWIPTAHAPPLIAP